jgi:ankyrin repeat protein
MTYAENSPFYELLATKHEPDMEATAIALVEAHPEIATLQWPGPSDRGQPFVTGATALHYAANDGRNQLAVKLLEFGADVNASDAEWYRSVLSWAANNARNSTIRLLLEKGADPSSLDAMHAAAWGGSAKGRGADEAYAESLRILIQAGADKNDRRHCGNKTPLDIALESGNRGAIDYLSSIGAAASDGRGGS